MIKILWQFTPIQRQLKKWGHVDKISDKCKEIAVWNNRETARLKFAVWEKVKWKGASDDKTKKHRRISPETIHRITIAKTKY